MELTNEIHYAAFRTAFVLTMDCMLRDSLGEQHPIAQPGGFLDVYPLLHGTAPQIQLECLLLTWGHLHEIDKSLTPFDHGVIHAACEALAKMGELTTCSALCSVWNGPKLMTTARDHWLTSKVRVLQLTQDQKMASELVRLGKKIDDQPPVSAAFSATEALDPMAELLNVVGCWRASGDVILGSTGLLTEEEQDILRFFFEEQPGLLG